MTTSARKSSSDQRTLTRVRATVHRHGKDPIVLNGLGSTGHGHGSPTAIVGASETLKLGMEPDTFSIQLKEGSLDVQREIKAGDWIIFTWEVNGEAIFGSFGQIVVASRAEQAEQDTGAPDLNWTLSCESFGRVFARTIIWFDDYTNYPNNVGGQIMANRMNWVPGGSPDSIVARLALAWLAVEDAEGRTAAVGTSWRWPESLAYLGDHFIDGLLYRIGENPAFQISGYRILDDHIPQNAPSTVSPVSQAVASRIDSFVQNTAYRIGVGQGQLRGEQYGEQSLWSPKPGTTLKDIMVEWSHDILNELYFDVETEDTGVLGSLPDTPYPVLRIRERPFVVSGEGPGRGIQSPWFRLPTTHIDRGDWTTGSVSYNDAERLNLFLIYAAGHGMTNFEHYITHPPAYDADSIDKYGLRKWERTSRFSVKANGQEDWFAEIQAWHQLIRSWYALNHEWLSGSVGIPKILKVRPGHRLVVGDDHDPKREQFYVETVTRNWRYPSNGSTTIGVTRGYRGSDRQLVSAVNATRQRFDRRVVEVDTGEDDFLPDGDYDIPDGDDLPDGDAD